MSLLVPPHVAENMIREQQESEVSRHLQLAAQANSILEGKDHRLELICAKEKATSPDMVPGVWHVKRYNDGDAPNSYIPIVGDKGEYVEPSIDRIMAELNKRDMWRAGSIEAIYEAKKAIREAEKKQEEAELDEVAYEAGITAKVVMNQQSAPRRKTAAAVAKGREI